ncbi:MULTISPECIES: hypothetical protein [unclassified Mesorhizobium]|uniref:hypothetical protein n=1 Tax=unclassified Mesorhizobium TaxID=325217 RepID=UPI0024152900|nr:MULTISPECIES: hypothetical protein [unclassified Mesorhizobium]MDG4853734.1 hypothetical protein [Mesorhizobium sp. WSM4982]MDG4915580.1 hypothetical protein [Mesorhizobium sp. WSM4983]
MRDIDTGEAETDRLAGAAVKTQLQIVDVGRNRAGAFLLDVVPCGRDPRFEHRVGPRALVAVNALAVAVPVVDAAPALVFSWVASGRPARCHKPEAYPVALSGKVPSR